MSWYYAEDGTQTGPVTDEQFQALVASGQIKSDTLVWRSGMADWKTWGEYVGRSEPAPPAMPTETIQPAATPAATGDDGGTFDDEAFLAALRARGGYSVDIGAALSTGWDVVRGNFWPSVGVTLLIFLTQAMMSQIPCLGTLAGLFLSGPLMGGLYYFFLLQVRGRTATANEAFAGFKQPKFVHLMLAGFLTVLIQGAVLMMVMIPFALAMGFDPQNPESVSPLFFVWLPLVLAPNIFLTIIWYPVFIIVMDTGLSFWNAMELSRKVVQMRFWSWLLLMLVLVLLMIAGVLALCIGVAVAAPVMVAALTAAWDQVVRAAQGGAAAPATETLRN